MTGALKDLVAGHIPVPGDQWLPASSYEVPPDFSDFDTLDWRMGFKNLKEITCFALPLRISMACTAHSATNERRKVANQLSERQ